LTDLVFFYGTLMRGFERRGRAQIEAELTAKGRGWIRGALFDLGLYPGAIPASDSRVWGELYRVQNIQAVLAALDEIEGFRRDEPDASLYTRVETQVTLEEGGVETAWVYFYNAPLGQAPRIESGDYLQYLKVKR
jgi:gamma-glutamylcyclotransferase (GGCT)/AIG2-like uncharacterized protein YtfP